MITIGAPAARPAAADRAAADTIRARTVSASDASSSATSSPPQRYVAPRAKAAGRRPRAAAYASTASSAGASAGWRGDVRRTHAPRVSERTAARLASGSGTRNVRYRVSASIASNAARSGNRAPPSAGSVANAEPSSRASDQMPLARFPKPDQVRRIASPARRPSLAAGTAGDRKRAFTVSVPAPSSSATSSPCQRYVPSCVDEAVDVGVAAPATQMSRPAAHAAARARPVALIRSSV